jgi:hypothetical protein
MGEEFLISVLGNSSKLMKRKFFLLLSGFDSKFILFSLTVLKMGRFSDAWNWTSKWGNYIVVNGPAWFATVRIFGKCMYFLFDRFALGIRICSTHWVVLGSFCYVYSRSSYFRGNIFDFVVSFLL